VARIRRCGAGVCGAAKTKAKALVVKGDVSRAGGAARLAAGGFAPLSWSGGRARGAAALAASGKRRDGGGRGTEVGGS